MAARPRDTRRPPKIQSAISDLLISTGGRLGAWKTDESRASARAGRESVLRGGGEGAGGGRYTGEPRAAEREVVSLSNGGWNRGVSSVHPHSAEIRLFEFQAGCRARHGVQNERGGRAAARAPEREPRVEAGRSWSAAGSEAPRRFWIAGRRWLAARCARQITLQPTFTPPLPPSESGVAHPQMRVLPPHLLHLFAADGLFDEEGRFHSMPHESLGSLHRALSSPLPPWPSARQSI
jgi:hypothetical protein